jgi:hypothetical protein
MSQVLTTVTPMTTYNKNILMDKNWLEKHYIYSGSPKYMTPEVMTSRKYDTKAKNLYSLWIIIRDLFDSDDSIVCEKYITKSDH